VQRKDLYPNNKIPLVGGFSFLGEEHVGKESGVSKKLGMNVDLLIFNLIRIRILCTLYKVF
jgi:hypothetical protein